MRRKLDGLEPVQTDGRERLYDAAEALSRYFLGESLELPREGARLARERADAQAMKNAERGGELVDAHANDILWMGHSAVLAAHLSGVASKTALELAASTKPDECHRVVASAIK